MTRAFVRPQRFTSFMRHLYDMCMSATMAKMVIETHGSVDGVPVDARMDMARVCEAREILARSADRPS